MEWTPDSSSLAGTWRSNQPQQFATPGPESAGPTLTRIEQGGRGRGETATDRDRVNKGPVDVVS